MVGIFWLTDTREPLKRVTRYIVFYHVSRFKMSIYYVPNFIHRFFLRRFACHCFSPCTLFSKTIQSNRLLPAPRGRHCNLGLSPITAHGTSREPQPPLFVHLISLQRQRYQGKKDSTAVMCCQSAWHFAKANGASG